MKLCGRHYPRDCYHCALDAWGQDFTMKFEDEALHKGFLGYYQKPGPLLEQPVKTPDPGCCSRYYECPSCDELFCEHGLFKDNPRAGDPNRTVSIIPWAMYCPKCEDAE